MNLMNVLKAYANEESIIVHKRDDRTVCEFGENGNLLCYMFQIQSQETNQTKPTHGHL